MSDNTVDRLVTRDPEAMEHQLEDAEYAGSDALEGLGSGLTQVRAGNLGSDMAVLSGPAASNPNPHYVPPSQDTPPHPGEGVADLPRGAPAEAELEDDGMKR